MAANQRAAETEWTALRKEHRDRVEGMQRLHGADLAQAKEILEALEA